VKTKPLRNEHILMAKENMAPHLMAQIGKIAIIIQ